MDSPGDRCGGGKPIQVDLSVSVLVNDPDALMEYSRRRFAACWSDSGWSPENLAEAVLEALVVSNENPSPADYGIEIAAAEARPIQPG